MLGHSGYTFSAQDKTYHLFDEPRKFLMKPDIVIKNKALGQVFVMDTKWKVLSDAKANYGISQADMYQMYAYQKKYTSENVTLLYPLTEKVEQDKDIRYRDIMTSILFLNQNRLYLTLGKLSLNRHTKRQN